MASPSRESLADGLNSPPLNAVPVESLPKLKGRKRLLHGLHRMSSSQSLLRLNRTPSSGYRGLGKGSISCISLSSSSASYASPFSNGYSTAPTSGPGTPGLGTTPTAESSRVRFVTTEEQAAAAKSPLSVPVPSDFKALSRPATSASNTAAEKDYFSCQPTTASRRKTRPDFNFWKDMPAELKGHILKRLQAKEIIKCSRVCRAWYKMCFDGQLWAKLDTGDFYRDIPADALVNIITKAGPFARDLNLRGCIQLWDQWRATSLADCCGNLENISLEGCRIDRSAIHSLLYQNGRLEHINVCGLGVVTNTTLKIIAQQCPKLTHLNVSWCHNVDTWGLLKVVESCSNLRDLRAGELRGFADKSLMNALFLRNTLERLILVNCEFLTDETLTVLFEGMGIEKDWLTGRPIVPPRKLKHLDISRCRSVGDDALLAMVGNAPDLEGLQLAGNSTITDASLTQLLPTLPKLTHLDLEELELLTNATLLALVKSPCKDTLLHLSISYCENLGDVGMLPVIKDCTSLRSLELDNTRISDLALIEAASAVRSRPQTNPNIIDPATAKMIPEIGLSMAVYDCQNVTWTGIREVLSRNAEIRNPRGLPLTHAHVASAAPTSVSASQSRFPSRAPTPSSQHHRQYQRQQLQPSRYPTQIIALKVFYGYQPTVTEHMTRCLRGDFAAAARLERKWAEYMIMSEEAGAPGGFGPGGFGLLTGVIGRRRRRRLREARGIWGDEEGGLGGAAGGTAAEGSLEEGAGGSGVGVGRRRRARSGGSCAVM